MTYLKYECSEYKSKEKNDIVTNDKTSGDLTYVWLARPFSIVRDSILTGMDQKRLQVFFILRNTFFKAG